MMMTSTKEMTLDKVHFMLVMRTDILWLYRYPVIHIVTNIIHLDVFGVSGPTPNCLYCQKWNLLKQYMILAA